MKVKSGELTENGLHPASLTKLKTQGGHKSLVPAKMSTMLSRLQRVGAAVLRRPALVASLTVAGLLLLGRQLSWLEPLELTAFDQLMQTRPALPPDPRLLVVKVTEADLKSYHFPLTDAEMNQLLAKLEQYQPAVIGIDIYRDHPEPPGHEQLTERLRKSDRIIPMCKRLNEEVAQPPGVPESHVGFNNISVDAPGDIVRKALLVIPQPPPAASHCTTPFSFSFQLARRYLEQKGIQPENTPEDYLKLGKVVFKPLVPNSGGYQNADVGGFQILLNYRSGNPDGLARSVTLSDVLTNKIDPSWVKDRIILIGNTAPSLKDAFSTPYSRSRHIQKMPGVVIHGQIVSQLLSSVLDGRTLFWFWPEWGEVLWIWVWSLSGGILVRRIRHPGQQAIAEVVALGLLLGTSVVLFLSSGWIPVVAPILGLLATSTGVIAYNAFEEQRERRKVEEEARKAEEEHRKIEQKAQEQEKNIALLQALLDEKTYETSTSEPDALPTEEDATDIYHPDDESEGDELDDDESEGDTTVVPPEDSRRPRKPPVRVSNVSLLAGHYKINKVLAAGGFGRTYLAQDTHRPGVPQCVVKQLKPARRDDRFLQVARRLFDTEAEILEKLGDHPQIPRLLAHFEEQQEFYLVQEYIDGHPLTEEMPVDKRLPETQVIELIKEVLEILVFIHDHKVIHRDLKPGNIMRREQDGKVVLIDFGAVKQIQPQQADQEDATVAVGTRGYAPSEQYLGHPTFSSDIYALGMIGVQALTGIPPYQLQFSEETGNLSWRHLANISEEFAPVMEKMVRYHFLNRYQSAAEVLEDLHRITS